MERRASFSQSLDSSGDLLAALVLKPPRLKEEQGAAVERAAGLLASMISLQEELDWSVYRSYGLLDDDLTYQADEPPPLNLGERAFEIVMARRMGAGDLETTWFERHGSTPITALPEHWPNDYKRLVETPDYWPTPGALQTTAKLADTARQDVEFMSVA
jgi:hypothetical protein